MWSEIVSLFSNYNLIALICMLIGLILACIECFMPGFGAFGITGSVFIVFSIVYLLIIGGTISQILFMVGIVILVLTIVILIAIRSARFGLISKSPLVQSETALPTDFSSNEKNYSFLLNKTGKTETICKPIGKVIIESETYEVITNGELIAKDKDVILSQVDGSTIIVKEIK